MATLEGEVKTVRDVLNSRKGVTAHSFSQSVLEDVMVLHLFVHTKQKRKEGETITTLTQQLT